MICLSSVLQFCDNDERPPTDSVPSVLEPIMKLCWSKEPNERPDFLEVVPLLDNARRGYFLQDPSEVSFWQAYFPLLFKVPFKTFVDKLWNHHSKIAKTTKSTCDFLSSLNDIIGSVPEIPFSYVSLLSFKKLSAWFGPLFTGQNFIEFCQIMKKPWYFNTITGGGQAESALSKDNPGIFIVRRTPDILQPEKIGYPFTIDYVFHGEFVHHRVARLPNGFYQLIFNGFIYEKESMIELMETLFKEAPKVFEKPAHIIIKVNYTK